MFEYANGRMQANGTGRRLRRRAVAPAGACVRGRCAVHARARGQACGRAGEQVANEPMDEQAGGLTCWRVRVFCLLLELTDPVFQLCNLIAFVSSTISLLLEICELCLQRHNSFPECMEFVVLPHVYEPQSVCALRLLRAQAHTPMHV